MCCTTVIQMTTMTGMIFPPKDGDDEEYTEARIKLTKKDTAKLETMLQNGFVEYGNNTIIDISQIQYKELLVTGNGCTIVEDSIRSLMKMLGHEDNFKRIKYEN